MKTKIDEGLEIYEDFCKLLPTIKRMTPTTYSCEMYARLYDGDKMRLLWREMLKEYMRNLEDTEIVLSDGVIYTVSKETAPL